MRAARLGRFSCSGVAPIVSSGGTSAVLDTNNLISGLLQLQGAPAEVLRNSQWSSDTALRKRGSLCGVRRGDVSSTLSERPAQGGHTGAAHTGAKLDGAVLSRYRSLNGYMPEGAER